MSNIIENAMEYVKQIFTSEYSGHDYHHTIRVYRNALLIAEDEEADRLIVQLAALLHDVDDIKLFPEQKGELVHAKEFMEAQGLSQDVIDAVELCIHELSFKAKDTIKPSTIEGQIVQDADRLDAIGAIGIARVFAFGGHHNREIYNPDIKPNLSMNEQEYRSNRNTSINHFYEKLLLLKDLMNTKKGQMLAKQRHDFMELYLQQFFDEWNGNR